MGKKKGKGKGQPQSGPDGQPQQPSPGPSTSSTPQQLTEQPQRQEKKGKQTQQGAAPAHEQQKQEQVFPPPPADQPLQQQKKGKQKQQRGPQGDAPIQQQPDNSQQQWRTQQPQTQGIPQQQQGRGIQGQPGQPPMRSTQGVPQQQGPGDEQQKWGPPQAQWGPTSMQQWGPQGRPSQGQLGQQQRGPRGMPPQGQPGQQQWSAQGMPPQGQRGQQQWGPRGMPPQGQPGQQQWGPRGMPPQGQPGQQQWSPRGMPPQGQPGQQQWSPRDMPPQGQPGQQQLSPPGMPPQGQPQMRGPHQQQQRAPPPGLQPQSPPPGLRPQSPPQQQQQRSGPQQQQQRRPGQQQQQRRKGQQQLQPQPQSHTPHPEPPPPAKEMSPPFGGQGDCLSKAVQICPGKRGRKIPVEVNHFALTLGTLMEAYHYDVAIKPDTPKCLLRDVMNLFGQRHYPRNHPAFDGRKNLYSPQKLPFGPSDSKSDKIQVQGENSLRDFEVEVKLARIVDLSPLHNILKTRQSPQDALQCLDIVLRNAASNSCITAGRCFFTPPREGQIIPLGDGMEMYHGFYQSAIRGWKPLLNVDVAHKAFPKSLNLLDLVCELGSDYRSTMTRDHLSKPIADYIARDLEKFLKQLKVKYEITGQSGSKRVYRVNGLGTPAAQAKFKLEDGRMTTVDKYYQDVKRCRLRYPHLPTLWVGARERESKILLPLEFCTIVEGQAVNRRMNENQTSNMIKQAATNTDVRKRKIMQSMEKAKYNTDACIREFGFSVNDQFEKLDARVLDPPKLQYANNAEIKPFKGVWRSDRNKFLNGAVINKWTIAFVTRQPCRVEKLADMIYNMANQSGMQINERATQPFLHVQCRQPQDLVQFFNSKKDFDVIFIVVPNSGPQYSYVKQAAEIRVGCLTQCIKERTVFKLNPQTVGNILLKVNSKMNGTNHCFATISRPPIMARPCMIMGADVTHPSPDARDIPSVAAVTASHDPKAFQYNICWRLQPPKVEIIEDLYNITKEQLMFFYKKTSHKPERIIFFRDGVSEGQFREVQRAEISAIQRACKSLQKDDYEPKITFLVVQKRHHTRLFPVDPRDSEDRNMNVPAGTCVDITITNPTMQDFYLVSHASIQGVAKPTKYCTLWDDNNMSNDDIEELTYHLCHMFTRCNRSVSYPAPTYYAHLAAARAKVYVENVKLNMDQLKKHQDDYQIQESILKGKPMFFV